MVTPFPSKTPDLDPLGSEQSMDDVESMNEFEPLFAEEQPEVEKPVTTVQVCHSKYHMYTQYLGSLFPEVEHELGGSLCSDVFHSPGLTEWLLEESFFFG